MQYSGRAVLARLLLDQCVAQVTKWRILQINYLFPTFISYVDMQVLCLITSSTGCFLTLPGTNQATAVFSHPRVRSTYNTPVNKIFYAIPHCHRCEWRYHYVLEPTKYVSPGCSHSRRVIDLILARFASICVASDLDRWCLLAHATIAILRLSRASN